MMLDTIKERKQKIKDEVEYSELPAFPKEIFLDLTSFCNHACVFCANPLITNKKTMDEEMVYRVLQETYDCGVREIGLYATGESFLVKNLADYIKKAKDIGHEYLFITTNGALATPERAIPAIEAGLDSVKFSISAGTRETYKQIQGKDDFDTVIENLKAIHAFRKSSGRKFRLYVTMVYTDKTESEVETLRKIVEPYIDEWDPHLLSNQCGNMYENNDIGSIEVGSPRGRGKTKVCFQPFKGFTITPEGYISACVLDYSMDLIVGDLHKSSLKEIWEGEVYRRFRRMHLDRKLKGSICINCMYNKNEPVEPLMPEYSRNFQEKKDEKLKKQMERLEAEDKASKAEEILAER